MQESINLPPPSWSCSCLPWGSLADTASPNPGGPCLCPGMDCPGQRVEGHRAPPAAGPGLPIRWGPSGPGSGLVRLFLIEEAGSPTGTWRMAHSRLASGLPLPCDRPAPLLMPAVRGIWRPARREGPRKGPGGGLGGEGQASDWTGKCERVLGTFRGPEEEKVSGLSAEKSEGPTGVFWAPLIQHNKEARSCLTGGECPIMGPVCLS